MIDLAAIEARTKAATPGPWYEFGLPWFPDELGVLAGSNDPHTGTFVADLDPLGAIDDDAGKWAKNPADAAFIAHARTDVPAMAAALRAAGGMAAAVRAYQAAMRGDGGDVAEEYHRLGTTLDAFERADKGRLE